MPEIFNVAYGILGYADLAAYSIDEWSMNVIEMNERFEMISI